MASAGYVLGIDFGTSTTVAVLSRPGGGPEPLLFDASPLLPSAVLATPGPEMLTGADAVRSAIGNPGAFEPNPKRRIDDASVWLNERAVPVVDLVAAVLARVTAEAHRVGGGAPERVLLTHPAHWGRTRLEVLRVAASAVGLSRVEFVAEPVAAAAYFVDVLGRDVPVGGHLVVYDFGAGTFDVSVVRRTQSGFEVVSTGGLEDVGGLDIDAAVVAHVRELTGGAATDAWSRLDWPRTPSDLRARQTLWQGVRAAKEQLSRHTTADLHVPVLDADLHLTREQFDTVAWPPVERTVELTHAVVRQVGVPPEAVAGLLLVGGSSRIPLVATMLHRALRIAPTVIEQPELVVARGSVRTASLARTAAPLTPASPVASPPPFPQPPAGGDPIHHAPAAARSALPAGAAGLWAPPVGGPPGPPSGPHRAPSGPPVRRPGPARWVVGAVAGILVIAAVAFGAYKIMSSDGDRDAPDAIPSTACTWSPAGPGVGNKDVGQPGDQAPASGTVTLSIVTNLGEIVAIVDRAAAPCTAASIAHLAGRRFFDNTTCHRLTTDALFVLQCGDPSGAGTGGPTYRYRDENLPTERGATTVTYRAGTVAMANSGPNSNGSQFFIVYRDTTLAPTYPVLGQVTRGLDIVERVAAQGVKPGGNGPGDGVPNTEIVVRTLSAT